MAQVFKIHSLYFTYYSTDHDEKDPRGGKKSYFDPVEREFLWIYDNDPRDRSCLIEIERLEITKLYRRFLHMFGYYSPMDAYEGKTDWEFETAVRHYSKKYGFEDEIDFYVYVHVNDYMYDWALQNNIEHFKLIVDPYLKDVSGVELHEIGYFQFLHYSDQIEKEKQEDEQYEKHMREEQERNSAPANPA